MSVATDQADIAIIGAGAAGLAAAIFAAQSKAPGSVGEAQRIVVLDGAATIGAKILVAGGGRCNVTHDVVTVADFNGSKNIIKNVLAAFDAAATVRWFESLGVTLKREETGKLFPVTDSARTVLNALLDRCRQLGVTIQSSSKVTGIEPTVLPLPPGEGRGEGQAARVSKQDGESTRAAPHPNPLPEGEGTRSNPTRFQITHTAGTLIARKIILATGGRSLPRSGSDGSGYALARSLGHTVTPTYMGLAPLVLDPAGPHAELSGLSIDAELITRVAGKEIDRRTGSLLFTHFGLSGPVVMDASRHWIIARETGLSPEMRVNFLPGESPESGERKLIDELAARPKAAVGNVLAKRFPERLALALLRQAKVDPATLAGQVSREARRAIVSALTALPLPISQPRGWNYAEVTAGGVPLNEIDYRTMQSRKTPGLFLAGEILDCDGRIGGFNFQWAWATGFLAGTEAGRR